MHTNFFRIQQLKEWLMADESDHFSRYALALEYGKANDTIQMRQEFEWLLLYAPMYLPTYYHAGSLYEELGEPLLAEATFAKGIKVGEVQQDKHALQELRAVHYNLLLEYDMDSTL